MRILPILIATLALNCAAFGKSPKTALDVAQLACVMATGLTDAELVTEACQIERELAPELERILAARARARRAGSCLPPDGGAP